MMGPDQADVAFARWLAEHHRTSCPQCGKIIDRGDVAWNSGSTEAGTPFIVVEIQCLGCQAEIAHWSSWYPGVDSFEELVESVLRDWEEDQ